MSRNVTICLCVLGVLLSFADAILTNQIGFEANPLLMSSLGPKLYLIKLFTIPLFAVLVWGRDRAIARIGLGAIVTFYTVVVVVEAIALGVYG